MFRILLVISVVFNSIFSLPIDGFNQFIVNGTNAAEGEFPYIVSLIEGSSGSLSSILHTCGASIINEEWLLTAAHCVEGNSASEIKIKYGVTDISSDKYHVVSISKIVVHEEFTWWLAKNDIALLKVQTPLEFNEFVQPVKLPKQDQETPANSVAILVGWGFNASDGSIQTHLQKVELITYSDEDCYDLYNGNTLPTNMCAGVPGGGKGQCSGDSGGPLTVDGVQVGIVSYSRKPCGILPGVYTKVSKYVDWIHKNSNV